MDRPVFPFTALVGQERLKRGLLLNAVNPRIGGILIRGEKGTAKSTAVRAFARLLPEVAVVADCRYGCDPTGPLLCESCAQRRTQEEDLPARVRRVPLVDLPVGATEDRVIGTLNLEQAIKSGERAFEPGLLAAANQGILYVDEVNLLADHLVDVLLDAAAMGQNYVEREGISVRHPAQFILVGTMNPEEGELRPQLLDRFALCVAVEGLADPAERSEVVRRRIAFEADPVAFLAVWQSEEAETRARIRAARALLPRVQVADPELTLISRICVAFGVDGLRGDLVMYKTAQALAAWAGREVVTTDDVREAAEFALPHRRRRGPFDDPEGGDRLDEVIREQSSASQDARENLPDDRPGVTGSLDRRGSAEPLAGSHPPAAGVGGSEQQFAPGAPFALRRLAAPAGRRNSPEAVGRRSRTVGAGPGRYVGWRVPNGRLAGADLAFDATLRAAAVHQPMRRAAKPLGPALRITADDLRERLYERRVGNLLLFVVDASGSMAARRRMVAVKGAVLALLRDAYQKRDRVGLISFRGPGAELLLPPTNSVARAERALRALPTGGRTPLAHALQLSADTLQRQDPRPGARPWLILVSDGRPNVPLQGGDALADADRTAKRLKKLVPHVLVVDTEEGPVRLGRNRQIARSLGGEYLRLEELAAGSLVRAVRERTRFGGANG